MDRMTDEEREKRIQSARRRQEALKSGQAPKRKRSRIVIVVFIVALIVFAVSAWQLAGILLNYRKGNKIYDDIAANMLEETIALPDLSDIEFPEEEDETKESSEDTSENIVYTITVPDFSYLRSLNPDIVAWIQIPGTVINYPVVQGSDNEYYLTHTATGETNSNGAIFIDALITDGFSDKNVIIYGHNMRSGAMFGTLSRYSSRSYFAEHPYIYITTPDGLRVYEIFSAYQIDRNADVYWFGFSENDVFQEYLDKVKSYSAYDTGVSVTMHDDIITLSTCASNSTQRFIVHAKRI